MLNRFLNWLGHILGLIPRWLNLPTWVIVKSAKHEAKSEIEQFTDQALEAAQEGAVRETTRKNAQGKVGQSGSPLL